MKASEEFVKNKHGIGYVGSRFEEYFANTEFETKPMPVFKKLPRAMNDAAIESELKPGLCELGDVLAFLDSDALPQECKDGYANIFYTPAFVVNVVWDGGEWDVGAWERDDFEWSADYRVFSPATVNFGTGVSSDTFNLEPSYTAFVLKHNRTGKIIPEAGVSFDRAQIEPNAVYAEEYSVVEIKIPKNI